MGLLDIFSPAPISGGLLGNAAAPSYSGLLAPAASQATAPAGNDVYARNSAWAKPADSYLTTLAPDQETQFQQWVKQNNIRFDPSPAAEPDERGYDMRGFWKGLQEGDAHAHTEINPSDNRLHFSDWWKTPYHESFSNESQWALPNAPHWNDKDQLIGSDGAVVFDERAMSR